LIHEAGLTRESGRITKRREEPDGKQVERDPQALPKNQEQFYRPETRQLFSQTAAPHGSRQWHLDSNGEEPPGGRRLLDQYDTPPPPDVRGSSAQEGQALMKGGKIHKFFAEPIYSHMKTK